MSYCLSIQILILITRRNEMEKNEKYLEMTVIIRAYFALSFIFSSFAGDQNHKKITTK